MGAAAPVTAQSPVASLTLDEAVSLASAANPTVRAKEFENGLVARTDTRSGA